MGKITPIDIVHKGERIVREGERISARHIRKIESAKIKTLDYQRDSMEGFVLAKDYVDKNTGEILLESNSVIEFPTKGNKPPARAFHVIIIIKIINNNNKEN